MEQKQLDDLEDSFFGEEFIEDLEDLPPVPAKTQEIKIEPREEPTELRLRKTAKKMSSPIFKKSAVKKSEKMTTVKPSKETMAEEKSLAAEKASEAKMDKESKEKKTLETQAKKETATINIKPAKEQAKVSETKPVVETSSPVNPWEEDNKGPSLFKEASTWKALTGIMLVLLVLSLFTQGFNFAEKKTPTGGAVLTLAEAEQDVLQFVNTQLLQAPFQAEVQSTEELDTLYKVTLSVAGQMVDSYVTKDGKLFFPQGLDMDEAIPGQEVEVKPNPKELDVEVETETEKPVPSEPELAPETEEPQEVEESAAGDTVKLNLDAKKWIFHPNVLRVAKGSKVVLTVVPTGLDFTFAVPALGVEQKVAGTTEVVFTADKAGTFDFTCGSCEDWRGMRGNLVVESPE